jgi:hypothetical protein
VKTLRPLFAAIVVFALVGCQHDKHAQVSVDKELVLASPRICYVFDQDFRAWLGPQGVTGLEKALREAHPRDQLQIDFAESNN